MKIRAAIFDVYGTLLEIGPPPADAEARWRRLWRQKLRIEPRLSRLDFSAACGKVIEQRHDEARARGIRYPEIVWPSVVMEVLPELARLPHEALAEFILAQADTDRTVRLAKGAPAVLHHLHQEGSLLGIASNAQAYTLPELQAGLAEYHLSLAIFETDLCFWSFQHGFSKPDPHVFQILAARLEARGIPAAETLAIGDRLDNDIEPARSLGWRTWHLSGVSQAGDGGWQELLQVICGRESP